MADLAEGRQYGLCSENSSNKNKSVLHVKLTDSALKALQEYQRIKDATSQKASIRFQGSNGIIKVPVSPRSDNGESLRTFNFTLSTIPTDPNGSFECFKQSTSASELDLMGVLQQKISIRATDESYSMTRERMTQAEEESKKQRAKEIKPSGLGVGRRVKKVIRNTTTSNASRPTSLPNLHKTYPPSNSSHATIKKDSGILNVPLRERIIHILALRPYKKPELLLKLQKDGIKSHDKNSISSVLNQIGKFNPRDNNFTLPKYLLPEVRTDWPFYTETDRQLLKRRLAQMNESPSANTSPAVSPCNSTSSQGSPVSVQKHLIPEPKPSDQPSKKRRVAHINHKQPADNTSNNLGTTGSKPTHSSLHQDDMKNHDKNQVSSVLNQVGNISLKDNVTDKKLLKRRLNQFNESALSSTSPAVSPCHSTGSQGSPTNSQKPVIADDKSSDQLIKKRRVAHVNHKEPADLTKGNVVPAVNKQVVSSLQPESPSNNNQENKIVVDSDSLDDKPDYLRLYHKISSSDQRQNYKADFNAEYDEYRELHSRIMAVTNKFLELKEQLQKHNKGSVDYKNICKRIKSEFKLVKDDPKYLEQRHRHDYLHRKLGHIKKLISEYDKSRSNLS